MNTPVSEWDEVVKRRAWTLVRAYFASVAGQKIPIRALGRANVWYASRALDTLDDFVTCSWDQLLQRTSFGRKKLDLLLAILVEAIERETGQPLDLNKENGSTRASEPTVANPAARLVALGIAPDFPLRLCRLSSRVLNFCTTSNIATIPLLMEVLRRDGEAGLLKRENLGRKSVAEIAGLCAAIERSSDADLVRYLPYDIKRRELSFSAAITATIQALEPDERLMLTRRLIEQQTLDEVGSSAGISRERVRQIEANFLANISAAIEWFQTDKERLFERLRSHHSIDDLLTGIDALAHALAVKAIAAAFWQTSEGRVATKETDERFSAWADEIRNSPEFYFGEIFLRTFLESKDHVASSDDFVAYCEQKRLFQHEKGSDALTPFSVTLKRVAAVIANSMEGALTDSELVDQLHRVPDLRDVTVENLRRNYSVWKTDPEFPSDRIRFAEGVRPNALRQAGEALENVAKVRTHRPSEQRRDFPREEAETGLDSYNLLIAEMAGAVTPPTILGLLPISPDQQLQILAAVVEAHQRQFRRLLRLLELFPGATSYALACAAGKGMDTSAFWEPIHRGIQMEIPPMSRYELAAGFQRAIHTIGLLEAEPRVGNHLWPVLFQAGIVPQFVPQLAGHIRIFLERNAPPDYEDQSELERFAGAIREKIPQAWVRLREILGSPAGLRVCAAILEAHREDNFDLLPPHLRQTIREAFAGVESRSFFATPHLLFDRGLEQIQLHLPKQTRKILQPASFWQISADKTAPADEATTIAIDEITPHEATIYLRNVRPPFAEWSRRMEFKPDAQRPAQVFRLPRGKQISVSSVGEVRLPFGDYAIVTKADTASNIEEGWAPCGEDRKWIDYTSFPGQLPLQIDGESPVIFIPKDEPAILVVPKGGSRLATTGEDPVYYGTGLQVSIHVPMTDLADELDHELTMIDANEVVAEKTVFSATVLRAQTNVEDPEWTAQAIAKLPAGIHQLTLTLTSSRRSVKREIFFWKDFQHPEQEFGFICRAPVANVDFSRSSGIRAHSRGIAVSQSWAEPEIRIALKKPAVILTLAKPGVAVGLQSPSGGEIEYRPLGQLLEFGSDDMTRIIIEFNQVGEWHLLAGQTIIRNFPNGCGTFTQRVQSFFHEFGEATALYAESLGDTKVHLVTVTRLTLAQDLRLTINPGSKTYSGSFKLGNAHTQLGISCRNFVKGDDPKPGISFLELRSGSARLETVPLGPIVDLEIEPVEGANLIRFLMDQRTMTAGGYEIEFVCRKQPTDEWTTLRVAESQGICGTRMLLVPDPFAPTPESLWEDVLSTTWRSFDQGDVAPDALRFPIEKRDLEICFARFQHIFDYHYSSAGWGAARWLRVAFGRLCKEAAAAAPSDLARIAVIGLCEKATDTAALYRPLIFGDQPELWALTPEAFESDLYPVDSVGECFGALGTLGKCAGLNEFLAQRQNVDVFVFGSFRRAPGGRHTYDFGHFSRELVKALADFELDRAVRPPLLSIGHFAQALHNLRRNIEALLRERDPEDINRPARHGAISSILGFHSRLPAVEGSVRDKLHVQNCELDIDVYAPLPGPEIRRLVFTLTALARLRSFGKVNADEYRRHLGRVFNAPEGDPRNIQKGATLLLDLAPELFACALLFWEVILFEQQ